MSTQLILYPQTYEGEFNSTSTPSFSQYIVNGINFTGLDSTVLHNTTAVHPTQDAITNSPPSILGNWYRYTTTGGDWGAVTAPALALGSIQLSVNTVTPGHTGVYQKLSGLSVGGIYDVKIAIVTGQVGFLAVEMYSGTNIQFQQPFSSNTTLITTTFTAQTTNDIFLLDYTNDPGVGATILIQNISIKESATSPTAIFTELYDGQVICDLYQEEDIPLTLSIDDFKNVAEQVKSYSKDFNLPATKRNNQIFNNMFEVTRSDDGLIFNPYIKTKCVLKQDGFILFEGYLRMIDIKDKEGEISYNVNLYSEVIALADILKDKTFAELDFSELEHDYNYTEIRNSWQGILTVAPLPITSFANNTGVAGATTTNVLKYPFIDWNHNIIISPTTGNPILPNLETVFRPCISLKYIINKIFADTNQFNWTSNFFDSADFEQLFMDFNWGTADTPNDWAGSGWGYYYKTDADNYATASFAAINITADTFPANFGFDTSTNIFTVPAGQSNSTYSIAYNSTFRCRSLTAATADLELRWLHTPSGGTAIPINATTVTMESSASANLTISSAGALYYAIASLTLVDGGFYSGGAVPTVTFSGGGTGATALAIMTGTAVTGLTLLTGGSGYDPLSTEVIFNSVNPLYTYSGTLTEVLGVGDTLQLQMKASLTNSIRQNNTVSIPSNTTSILAAVSADLMTDSIILNTLRGQLGQWEFLKGIMTMFNLVSLVDESNPNNILIEPYSDVFIKNTNGGAGNLTLADRGIQHDWTDKVDVSQMELKPLTDLNQKTIFKFVEDEEDYAFKVYKDSTSGHLYGSKSIDESAFTILEGKKEIIAEPFAATVSKPLDDQFMDFIVPSLYSMNDDGDTSGFDNSPRIFYNNYVKILTSCTYSVPTQNGVAGDALENEFLQFSHLSTIPTVAGGTIDFLFESQQLIEPIGSPPINNLYNTYWFPYFSELYHADTRIMTLKVNLSPADVASFKFYDMVFIKNRTFRVNRIDYKPNDLATVEFILIP
tara:strand:+ start:1995 stop:5009 length:3015 start_codon:yes stop_codon:yes gene_type:complete